MIEPVLKQYEKVDQVSEQINTSSIQPTPQFGWLGLLIGNGEPFNLKGKGRENEFEYVSDASLDRNIGSPDNNRDSSVQIIEDIDALGNAILLTPNNDQINYDEVYGTPVKQNDHFNESAELPLPGTGVAENEGRVLRKRKSQ